MISIVYCKCGESDINLDGFCVKCNKENEAERIRNLPGIEKWAERVSSDTEKGDW